MIALQPLPEAERICLQVLLSIPCILSDRQMFFPEKRRLQVKIKESLSIGSTPVNSNANTPLMKSKMKSTYLNRVQSGDGSLKSIGSKLDKKKSTISETTSSRVDNDNYMNYSRKRFESSESTVDDVTNKEQLLNRHLFRAPSRKHSENIQINGDDEDVEVLNQSSDYDITLNFEK